MFKSELKKMGGYECKVMRSVNNRKREVSVLCQQSEPTDQVPNSLRQPAASLPPSRSYANVSCEQFQFGPTQAKEFWEKGFHLSWVNNVKATTMLLERISDRRKLPC